MNTLENLNADAWTVYGQRQLDREFMPPVPEKLNWTLDMYPDWLAPLAGTPHPRLSWVTDDEHPGAAQIGALMTASPIAIPGAVFHAQSADDRLLLLGEGHPPGFNWPRHVGLSRRVALRVWRHSA